MDPSSRTDDATAIQAVLRLVYGGLSRDDLETLTVDLQVFLDEHAGDVVDGASASADFSTSTIEIDLSIEGSSMTELQNVVAALVGRLEATGALQKAPVELASSMSLAVA